MSGKRGPKRTIVWSPERVDAHAVQVVGDDHQAARLHVGVQASGGVCQDQILDAEQAEGSDRQHHLFHIVAFVIVEPSLLDRHRNAADIAQNEPARMPLDRRSRETRDLLVRDLHCIGQLLSKRTQTAPEHDGGADLARVFGSNKFSRLGGFFVN